MAWPYDARIRTASAGTIAASSDHNSIQDRIVDLYRTRWQSVPLNMVALPGDWGVRANVPGGDPDSVGWECLVGTHIYGAHIPIQMRQSGVLYKAQIKHYNAAAAIVFQLRAQTENFGSASTAPSYVSSLLGGVTPTGTGWKVTEIDITSTPYTAIDDETLYLVINTPSVGDVVAGVRIYARPLTLTP